MAQRDWAGMFNDRQSSPGKTVAVDRAWLESLLLNEMGARSALTRPHMQTSLAYSAHEHMKVT